MISTRGCPTTLPSPESGNPEGAGRRGRQPQAGPDRHLPGEEFGLRRCDLKPQCTTNKNGRSLRRGPGDEHIDLVRAYMQTEPYLKAIRKRKVWIEPLFAEGRLWHGMRRFRMRTLENVNAEALLIAAGQNVKRLLAFGGRRPRKLAQAALRPPARPRPDLPATDS